MHRGVGFNICVPSHYAASTDRYPVIYWLHGAGGDESGGLYVAEHLQRAIASGTVPPMIIVFPNGGKKTEYRDWPEQNIMPESMIVKELIPWIDSHYRTVSSPLARALEGMSMGANGALKLAFKYPQLFGSVVAYAGSYKRLPLDGYFPGIAPEQQAWIAKLSQYFSPDDDVFELARKNSANLGHLRIRIITGTKDVSMPDGEALHELLLKLAIPHEYESLLGVNHDGRAYYSRAGLHGFQFQADGFRCTLP